MYFEDLTVGLSVTVPSAVIDKGEMLDFAVRYDNIPLHTDEAYAKATPFGALIAPGMMSFLCVWARYLEVDFFGEELLAGKSTRVEWHRPVFAEDVLESVATVTRLTERNEKNGIVEVSIEAKNQRGEVVLTSVTEAVVKKRRK